MKELSDAIRRMGDTHAELYSVAGVVSDIDIDSMTCTVSVHGEADIHGVKIQPMNGGNKGLLLMPKLGSEVIVTYMSTATAYVAMVSEIDQFNIEIDTASIQVKEDVVSIMQGQTKVILGNGKVQISSNGIDLGTLLNQLLDALAALTVTCTAPGSPSSPPLNAAQFLAIKTQLSQVL
jgi:hypothetical protein